MLTGWSPPQVFSDKLKSKTNMSASKFSNIFLLGYTKPCYDSPWATIFSLWPTTSHDSKLGRLLNTFCRQIWSETSECFILKKTRYLGAFKGADSEIDNDFVNYHSEYTCAGQTCSWKFKVLCSEWNSLYTFEYRKVAHPPPPPPPSPSVKYCQNYFKVLITENVRICVINIDSINSLK